MKFSASRTCFRCYAILVDQSTAQKYLILGSASRDLIKQSSESLAGRIAYHYLGGFTLQDTGAEQWKALWIKGGFPRSFLAQDEYASHLWRENYITTFLERDIPQLGITIPAYTLRRVLDHVEPLPRADRPIIPILPVSFGVSDMTVRKYIEILEGTFMVRLLQPWFSNIGKRLVKRPKLYLRDSGIFHTLMSIQTMNQLLSQPKLGASWEGFALEVATRAIGKRDTEYFFWRAHAGAELDLFWQEGGKKLGC